MATKTVHVYPSEGAWAVKKGGKRAKIFVTKREAIEGARALAVREEKKSRGAQVVVHGSSGRIQELRMYGMPKVQDPPKNGRLPSGRIAKAVGKVVLERLRSEPLPPRAHSRAK
jgi:hypothetical protein